MSREDENGSRAQVPGTQYASSEIIFSSTYPPRKRIAGTDALVFPGGTTFTEWKQMVLPPVASSAKLAPSMPALNHLQLTAASRSADTQVWVHTYLESHPGDNGAPVNAQHRNGYWYPARVVGEVRMGLFQIEWDDDDPEDRNKTAEEVVPRYKNFRINDGDRLVGDKDQNEVYFHTLSKEGVSSYIAEDRSKCNPRENQIRVQHRTVEHKNVSVDPLMEELKSCLQVNKQHYELSIVHGVCKVSFSNGISHGRREPYLKTIEISTNLEMKVFVWESGQSKMYRWTNMEEQSSMPAPIKRILLSLVVGPVFGSKISDQEEEGLAVVTPEIVLQNLKRCKELLREIYTIIQMLENKKESIKVPSDWISLLEESSIESIKSNRLLFWTSISLAIALREHGYPLDETHVRKLRSTNNFRSVLSYNLRSIRDKKYLENKELSTMCLNIFKIKEQELKIAEIKGKVESPHPGLYALLDFEVCRTMCQISFSSDTLERKEAAKCLLDENKLAGFKKLYDLMIEGKTSNTTNPENRKLVFNKVKELTGDYEVNDRVFALWKDGSWLPAIVTRKDKAESPDGKPSYTVKWETIDIVNKDLEVPDTQEGAKVSLWVDLDSAKTNKFRVNALHRNGLWYPATVVGKGGVDGKPLYNIEWGDGDVNDRLKEATKLIKRDEHHEDEEQEICVGDRIKLDDGWAFVKSINRDKDEYVLLEEHTSNPVTKSASFVKNNLHVSSFKWNRFEDPMVSEMRSCVLTGGQCNFVVYQDDRRDSTNDNKNCYFISFPGGSLNQDIPPYFGGFWISPGGYMEVLIDGRKIIWKQSSKVRNREQHCDEKVIRMLFSCFKGLILGPKKNKLEDRKYLNQHNREQLFKAMDCCWNLIKTYKALSSSWAALRGKTEDGKRFSVPLSRFEFWALVSLCQRSDRKSGGNEEKDYMANVVLADLTRQACRNGFAQFLRTGDASKEQSSERKIDHRKATAKDSKIQWLPDQSLHTAYRRLYDAFELEYMDKSKHTKLATTTLKTAAAAQSILDQQLLLKWHIRACKAICAIAFDNAAGATLADVVLDAASDKFHDIDLKNLSSDVRNLAVFASSTTVQISEKFKIILEAYSDDLKPFVKDLCKIICENFDLNELEGPFEEAEKHILSDVKALQTASPEVTMVIDMAVKACQSKALKKLREAIITERRVLKLLQREGVSLQDILLYLAVSVLILLLIFVFLFIGMIAFAPPITNSWSSLINSFIIGLATLGTNLSSDGISGLNIKILIDKINLPKYFSEDPVHFDFDLNEDVTKVFKKAHNFKLTQKQDKLALQNDSKAPSDLVSS